MKVNYEQQVINAYGDEVTVVRVTGWQESYQQYLQGFKEHGNNILFRGIEIGSHPDETRRQNVETNNGQDGHGEMLTSKTI